MRSRSDRRRDNRAFLARARVLMADAAKHCGCFGVVAGKPAFAVKPVDCGHFLEVRRSRVETLGGTIDNQVVFTKVRARPITSIALGLNVQATSHQKIRRIHHCERGAECRCF
jgi:hypothetical protein